jgi:type I restriction enzyme S subunit
MFTNLKPHQVYVDSGNQWFGRIPVSWQTSRLRGVSRLFVSNVDKLTQEHERPIRLCNYVDVYKNEFITDRPGYMTASASEDEIRRFRVRVDDVAITKDSESWIDIGIPAYVAQEADDLVCGYHLGLLRTRKDILSGAYLFRALQVPGIATQFHVAACGVTRYGLSQDDILSVIIPIPGLDEQAAIVKYLKHANARIDRAIAAKRKLIALLEEQKQAIIKQAVTRGLDPTVPLRDSGIPWLGQIPAHWATKRFGNVATARSIPGAASLGLLSVYLGRGVIHYSEGGKRVHAPSLDLSSYQEVRPGDFVMNNQQAWRGSVGVSSLYGIVSPAYHVYELVSGLRADFATHLLASPQMVAQYVIASKGVGDIQRQLHVAYLKLLTLPIPTLSEQRAIAAHLDSQENISDSAISQARREIELLREFKARLTADVVTGQVDILAAAARLPELDLSDLLSDPGPDEDDLDAELAAGLEEVDA